MWRGGACRGAVDSVAFLDASVGRWPLAASAARRAAWTMGSSSTCRNGDSDDGDNIARGVAQQRGQEGVASVIGDSRPASEEWRLHAQLQRGGVRWGPPDGS